MTSIVIPATDHRPQNKQHLENLLNCIDPNAYKVVVVCFDSCEVEFVDFFVQKFPFIHSLHNRGNPLKFTRNSNAGLRFIRNNTKEGCFLINQDCLIPSFKYMEKVVSEGLSTPSTTNLASTQEELDELNSKEDSTTRTRITNKFAFYCPYFSHELLKDVGLLDEDLKVLFSDDSYVLKTLLHGKYPIESVNVLINHLGSHLDTKKEGWESGSGSYNTYDLPIGLAQYTLKWSLSGTRHDDVIPEALKKHKWIEEMKVV